MEDWLREIQARVDAATPGPWKIEREELSVDFDDEEQETAFPSRIGPIGYWEPGGMGEPAQVEADADLIANAPTDLSRLLREVRRLREAAVLVSDAYQVVILGGSPHLLARRIEQLTAPVTPPCEPGA